MSGLSLFNKHSCRFSCSSYLQFHRIVLLSRYFFALLISCVIFLLTSLYFAAPSGSHFLLFNSLLLSQRSRMSAVTHGFFVRLCFPRISLAVSVTILLKVLVSKFTSVSLSSIMIRGANFPPIIALNASASSGSLSFSVSN